MCQGWCTGHGSPPCWYTADRAGLVARRNGRPAWREALFATHGLTGLANHHYRDHQRLPAIRSRKRSANIRSGNILRNCRSATRSLQRKVITSGGHRPVRRPERDHFYAHIKTTDFTRNHVRATGGTWLFYRSIAAGFVLSTVEPNPVLLNYGIDEFRFASWFWAPKSHRFTCGKIAE